MDPSTNLTESAVGDAVRPRPRRWRRWVVLSAITVVWLATMFQVWRAETGRTGASLRELGITREIVLSTWIDFDQWMKIERAGEWLGASHLSIRQMVSKNDPAAESLAAPPGFQLHNRTRLRLAVLGRDVPIDLRMEARMNSAFELETLRATLSLAGQHADLQAFVADQMLFYRIRTGEAAAGAELPEGVSRLFSLPSRDVCGSSPLRRPIILANTVLPLLNRSEKFDPGDTWTMNAGNPIFGRFNQPVEVTVEGKESIQVAGKQWDAWRLHERIGNVDSTVWYAQTGLPLRRQVGEDLVMETVSGNTVEARDPAFKADQASPEPIDRAWIREHQDPDLEAVALEDLLPSVPSI